MLEKMSKRPTEAAMWRHLKDELDVDYDRAYRIEAVSTPGFPDIVWIPYRKYPVLIELKAGPLKFRPKQITFIRDMCDLGTTVWVIWQKKTRGPMGVFKGIDLITDPTSAIGEMVENWTAFMRDNTWAKP